MSSVYQINKGVNRAVMFRGLTAQWIWWLGGGILFLLIFFAVMYIIGVHVMVCLLIVALLGVGLFVTVYKMSKTHGAFGLMKRVASKSVPKGLKGSSKKRVQRELCNENSERGIARMVS